MGRFTPRTSSGAVVQATTGIRGGSTIATLAELAAASDTQKISTSGTIAPNYIGYWSATRSYTLGQIVVWYGCYFVNIVAGITSAPPSAQWAAMLMGLQPLAANTTFSGAASSGGTGAVGSPFIIPPATTPSGTGSSTVTTVTITNLTPGKLYPVVDLNDGPNQLRFLYSLLIANGAGIATCTLTFTDVPFSNPVGSAVGTTYTSNYKIGTNPGVYVRQVRTIS